MAPLSILPGRIRYENESLRGDICGCRHLEARLNCAEGVVEASANHRTGRITIRFDESRVDRNYLEEQVKNARYCNKVRLYPNSTHLSESVGKTPKAQQSGMTGHTVIDVLAHAFLPKPFNILLPMALQTIRR
jgi:cation transport ATPase